MLKVFKAFSGQKGSFTVETTITFSTIVFAIIAILNISFLLYQQTCLKAIAQKAATSGALMWTDSSKDIYIGAIYTNEMNNDGLYKSIFDTNIDDKTDKVITLVQNLLTQKGILLNENLSINCKVITNFLAQKSLIVEISQKYEIPFGNLLEPFGFSKYFILKETANAYISHPAEVIRNTDLLLERFDK